MQIELQKQEKFNGEKVTRWIAVHSIIIRTADNGISASSFFDEEGVGDLLTLDNNNTKTTNTDNNNNDKPTNNDNYKKHNSNRLECATRRTVTI